MSKRMHVSLDLETLSSGTNAAILAIGAVEFDIETGKVTSEFYENIQVSSHVARGGQIDPKTEEWWASQPEEARAAFQEFQRDIIVALDSFACWLPKRVALWGNGCNFDNRVLREAYDLCGLRAPWHYREDRDLRTLADTAATLGYERPDVTRAGLHHHALHDAEFQAHVIFALMQQIRGGKVSK